MFTANGNVSELMNGTKTQSVKFAADRMLGRLAKWLRVLGQDVIYGDHLSGYGLIRAARSENRLILTRDRKLKQKQPPPFLFIESDHYREQLEQVVREFSLELGEELFTRCIQCNRKLVPVRKESVEKRVPPYVFATQDNFVCCPHCRRIYWPATHHRNMVEELRRGGIFRKAR